MTAVKSALRFKSVRPIFKKLFGWLLLTLCIMHPNLLIKTNNWAFIVNCRSEIIKPTINWISETQQLETLSERLMAKVSLLIRICDEYPSLCQSHKTNFTIRIRMNSVHIMSQSLISPIPRIHLNLLLVLLFTPSFVEGEWFISEHKMFPLDLSKLTLDFQQDLLSLEIKRVETIAIVRRSERSNWFCLNRSLISGNFRLKIEWWKHDNNLLTKKG